MKNDIKEMLKEVIHEELKPINEKLEVIDKKIGGLHEQGAKNAESIAAIRNVQERQEKTIDLLSRRSIDQEAELKRIK